jgi:hypothetical protein
MNGKVVISRLSLILIVILAGAAALESVAGCATLESWEHKYVMRGQILEVSGDTAYLCIGSADGAQPGQELTVYRFVRTGSLSPKSSLRYKREKTGKIRIIEVVDEHMANARIISGEAKEHYVVELE